MQSILPVQGGLLLAFRQGRKSPLCPSEHKPRPPRAEEYRLAYRPEVPDQATKHGQNLSLIHISLLQANRIGHEEVVANDLNLLAESLRKLDVAVPVALVETVLDRNDRVLVAPIGVDRDHLVGSEQFVRVGLPELVALAAAFVEQLGRCAIERDADLLAGLVTGCVDGFHDNFERFVIGHVRRETAFVTDSGNLAGLLQDALQDVYKRQELMIYHQ